MIDATEILARLFVHTPATVFSTLGLLLMAAAAGMAFRAIRLATGETIGGTIIAWHKRTSDDQVSYAPIMRFRAGPAGEFEVQSSTVFRSKPGDINIPVTVRSELKSNTNTTHGGPCWHSSRYQLVR